MGPPNRVADLVGEMASLALVRCLGYSAGLHLMFLVAVWAWPPSPAPLVPPPSLLEPLVSICDTQPVARSQALPLE